MYVNLILLNLIFGLIWMVFEKDVMNEFVCWFNDVGILMIFCDICGKEIDGVCG